MFEMTPKGAQCLTYVNKEKSNLLYYIVYSRNFYAKLIKTAL